MQSPFEWIGLIVQIGILGVLSNIAWNIRQVNAKSGVSFYLGGHRSPHYASPGMRLDRAPHIGGKGFYHASHGGIEIGVGYSIWIYRGGSWVLLQHCGQPGCECGSAPSEPGDYEGKVIRKECPQG